MFIGNLNLANIMTLAGLTFSVFACFFSFDGEIGYAIICLMASGLFDLFDGLVAGKLERSEKEALLGAQLDSLADLVCFGVTPIIIALNTGLNSMFDVALMAVYLCCAAMRLAYFNIYGKHDENGRQYYTGLPVTYAALIFPVVFISLNIIDLDIARNIVRLTFFVVALAFVLKVKIVKPKGIFYFLFPLIAAVLSLYWFSWA